MQRHSMIEFLAYVSHFMTDITNIFSGISVVVRAEVTGKKNGETAIYSATIIHKNTAVASGCGAGSVAQLLLDGKVSQSGVYPVEQILPTDLFLQAMQSRGIEINSIYS